METIYRVGCVCLNDCFPLEPMVWRTRKRLEESRACVSLHFMSGRSSKWLIRKHWPKVILRKRLRLLHAGYKSRCETTKKERTFFLAIPKISKWGNRQKESEKPTPAHALLSHSYPQLCRRSIQGILNRRHQSWTFFKICNQKFLHQIREGRS